MTIAAERLTPAENRTYIIGRRGDIRFANLSVSSRHAELVVLGRRMYLTDLDSTNGTYLVKGNQKVPFKEGYVSMEQKVAFGECATSIRKLLMCADTNFLIA